MGQEPEQKFSEPIIQALEVPTATIQKKESPTAITQDLKSPEYYISEVYSLVWAPVDNIGETREAIQKKLGLWISLETKEVENLYDSNQTDTVYILNYSGLILRIYEAASRDILVVVTMTQNYPGILPELIGLSRDKIESRY